MSVLNYYSVKNVLKIGLILILFKDGFYLFFYKTTFYYY